MIKRSKIKFTKKSSIILRLKFRLYLKVINSDTLFSRAKLLVWVFARYDWLEFAARLRQNISLYEVKVHHHLWLPLFYRLQRGLRVRVRRGVLLANKMHWLTRVVWARDQWSIAAVYAFNAHIDRAYAALEQSFGSTVARSLEIRSTGSHNIGPNILV